MSVQLIDIIQNINTAAPTILSEIISDTQLYNKIINHVCWCSKINPNREKLNLGGSTVVDYLDGICKSWFDARHCNDGLPGGVCQADTTLNPGTDVYQLINHAGKNRMYCNTRKKKYTPCQISSCQIDHHFSNLILDHIQKDMNQIFNNFPVPETDTSTCPSQKSIHPNINTSRNYLNSKSKKRICVGQAPNLDILTLNAGSCYCRHGVKDETCQNSTEMEKCVSCRKGYRLENMICVKNECTCKNGVASSICDADQQQKCYKCYDGYKLDNFGICRKISGDSDVVDDASSINDSVSDEKNVCTCENGIPEIHCPLNRALVDHCQSCLVGYHLESFLLDNRLCVED